MLEVRWSKLVAYSAFVVVLSACSKGLPVSDVVNLTTKSGSQGDQFVTIRTRVVDGTSDRGTEVADARCRLTLGNKSKSFSSPAKIRVPRQGATSPVIKVRCSHEGHRPSTITSKPFNVSAAERFDTVSYGGLIVTATVGVAGGFNDREDDIFGYKSDIVVTMYKK